MTEIVQHPSESNIKPRLEWYSLVLSIRFEPGDWDSTASIREQYKAPFGMIFSITLPLSYCIVLLKKRQFATEYPPERRWEPGLNENNAWVAQRIDTRVPPLWPAGSILVFAVSFGLSLLLVLSLLREFFSLHKNQHFQIPISPGRILQLCYCPL